MRTVTIEFVDELDLGALVHAEVPPVDADWEQVIDRWGRFARRVRSAGRQPLCLVVSRGGDGPNARQRRRLDEVNAEVRPRVAVATGSSVARGIVTAIAWFGHTEIRAFHPDELDAAYEYLAISPGEHALVERAVTTARADLAGRQTGT